MTVRTITSESNLRYLDWVSAAGPRWSTSSPGGRIGYIHLPNTAVDGNRDAAEAVLQPGTARTALIVDDRYNGGGFIPDRMIEMLSRTTLSYWARRGIEAFTTPGFAHDGPKAMLINGYAASGGDALPYYFRQAGLGPLIGTRTWGGLIGLSGNPMLVDGGGVLYPTFRFYDRRASGRSRTSAWRRTSRSAICPRPSRPAATRRSRRRWRSCWRSSRPGAGRRRRRRRRT